MGVADEKATGPGEMPTRTSPVVGPSKPRFLQVLGPGLIAGASASAMGARASHACPAPPARRRDRVRWSC
jgi:hypothetical protein